jgi:O-antigen/teichoic acid export membrane protein
LIPKKTALPASFFVAAAAAQLCDLFSGGGTYTRGIPYLLFITVFYAFLAIQTFAVSVLQGVGRTREVLLIGAITSIGEIIPSVVLVPSLGLAGAAVSRVAVMLAGCFF